MTSSTSGHQASASTKPIATGVIVHDAPPEQPSNPSWLCRTWNSLMHYLLRGNEPRISQKRNASGQVIYRCYDPHTGRSIHCTSEAEVREWLDRLPYC